MVRAVLFDLDGTLVDTAPDLGDTINALLARRNRPALAEPAIRAQASHGSQALIRLAFGVAEHDSGLPELRREFLEHYSAHLADRSTLFPGMDRLLAELEDRAIAWGVVTNKPACYTEPLLERLGLLKRAACVVSGDTCARSKPDPEPMWHACRKIDLAPERCLYVGDAERDIEAARAVHMPAIVALYGYLAETDQPAIWGGDGFIRQPLELLDYLNLRP
ncbi:MAG: phosphoglycolate phosphatase [Hydrogenophilales bacterium CG03_land_8_20_14_0_80_62_28]|nr:HAD-IA family hydrolase [Betaproteobacteria bacterium]PIV23643.1 MAG: phosphoglycolate phosphatase [Hydrogenophilales bacterium CG03_land_8_20_14_0_80_62_28]PIW38295.1 MAG: phosphoglycolate phosphatase [Hydrogenophilales bacterium CG15_BIG_FIL_POST_REV_8_21_14_020_62_31]PIW71644.1 MAG: phosphoglycolate phosphatase [Hydrogenophilales bacterium CG12_big_fil_rev_8_21_14_0_65_61_21]PIX02578.1 MAG: phosphoglycolate phosphatase [Hydrogenophilales bacterium CG_4_8_14_3_um_filter_62_83]PIY98184.1 M